MALVLGPLGIPWYSKFRPDLAVADLDEDGALDLVINENGVVAYRGDGHLGFAPMTTHDAPGFGDVVLADFDLDGHLDVVVGSGQTGGASDVFTLLRGSGQGPLREAYQGPGRDVSFGDVDGDGLLDMVALLDVGSGGEILAFPGLGPGIFGAPVLSSCVSYPGQLVLAHLDDDGHLDLVISAGARAWLQFGAGDLTFGAPVQLHPQCSAFGPVIAAADLDQDGDEDIVSVCFYQTSVHLGDGMGAFQEIVLASVTFGVSKGAVRLDDLDGDGTIDLVTTASSAIHVRTGLGDGTFGVETLYDHPGSFGPLDTADLNGDGHPDLAVAGSTPGSVALFLNAGDGTFSFATEVTGDLTTVRGLLLTDLDGDGRVDLVTAHADPAGFGHVAIRRGLGGVSFGESDTLLVAHDPNREITARDIDGDGDQDLIVPGDGATTILTNETNRPR